MSLWTVANTATAFRTPDTAPRRNQKVASTGNFQNASKPAAATRSVISIDAGDHRERVRARRDELVAQYTPLAVSIAENINRRTPPSIELEDLIQTGLVALMEAATCYRPDAFPGITFGAYAKYRVRGAILDSISGRHWQNATLDEIPDPTVAPDTEPATEPAIDEQIDREREMARVKDAIEYLEPRDRQIIASYYRDGGSFEAAGAEVGLTRRRAGELHADAIAKVRRILHVA